MKLKVTHIVDVINLNSGVIDFIFSNYKVMDSNIISFQIIYFQDSEQHYIRKLESYGIKCIKFDLIYFVLNKREHHDNLNKTLLGSRNCQAIVHNHVPLYTRFIFRKKDRLRNKHELIYIAHAHSSKLSNTVIKQVRNRVLVRNICDYYDFFWGCSMSALDAWFNITKISEGRYKVIPNPVDCDEITKAKKSFVKHPERKEELKLVTVGRLSPEKNHIFLIDLCKKIDFERIPVKLTIIGEGYLEESLKNYVVQLGLQENIEFCGYLNKNQLYKKMINFNYFLFPSKFEGLGTALIEAQMLDLECIASENIPQETDIGLVDFLPLDINLWFEHIVRNYMSNNSRGRLEIKQSSYCSHNASKILYSSYVDSINKQ